MMTNKYPRGFNLNLKNLEEARTFLKEEKERLNPHNTKINKPKISIRVLKQEDADLLNKAMVGMHNMKLFRVLVGEKKYHFDLTD